MDLVRETPREIDLIADRRRPGRLPVNNPHLIALLRQPSAAEVEWDEPGISSTTEPFAYEAEPDSLSAARGTVFGVLIGSCLWAAIIFPVWLVFWR